MNIDPQFWNTLGNVLIWIINAVAFLGLFPLSYIAYRGIAAGPTKKRLRNDLLLLGLVENDRLDETVDSLYLTTYSPSQFITYIVLILLTAGLVTVGFIYRQQLGWLGEEPVRLAFFGFLGAYVFSIQELIRRYNTFDLQPQVYSAILIRMLVAVIFVFVTGLAIQASALDMPTAGNGSLDWGPIIAFVVGVFPAQGTRWLAQVANRIFSDTGNRQGMSLKNIQGISDYHESRLQVLGIDDVQNLATADIRKILLTTRFDTQTIVSWIDQAILLTKVGDRIGRFRDANIHTFSELHVRLNRLNAVQHNDQAGEGQADHEKPQPRNGASPDHVEDERKRLATVFGINGSFELEGLCDYSNYLNFVHISKYYENAASVARELSIKAEKSILDRISDPNERGATLDELENDLRDSPDDPNLLINLGILYYLNKRIDKALEYLGKAIQINETSSHAYTNRGKIYLEKERYDEAIQDLTLAIRYDKANKFAFNYRGIALSSINHLSESVLDFTEAIKLDVRFAEAYLNRGLALNTLVDFEAAQKDFEINFLLDRQERFEMWYGWGVALLGLGCWHEAIEKLTQATRIHSKMARAYQQLGYAFMQVQPPEYEPARLNLDKAIELDPTLSAAYVNRGLLFAAQDRLEDAIRDYDEALKRDPGRSTALLNKGMALYRQGRFSDAFVAFQDTINKAQPDPDELNQAALMLVKTQQAMSPASVASLPNPVTNHSANHAPGGLDNAT